MSADVKIPIKELGPGVGFYVPIGMAEKTYAHRPIKQCFRLDETLLTAMDREQIKETVNDLRMLGLYKPPYNEFRVELAHSAKDTNINYLISMDFYSRSEPEEEYTAVCRLFKDGKFISPYDYPEELMVHLDKLTLILYDVLICLLATKNVVKTVHRNRLAKFGVGKQKTEYTTTLHIGKMQTEYEKGEPTGLTLRPHWRRGHARMQHYGPHNQMIKQIWIEPVFVNSDKEYVGERMAYNVIS